MVACLEPHRPRRNGLELMRTTARTPPRICERGGADAAVQVSWLVFEIVQSVGHRTGPVSCSLLLPRVGDRGDPGSAADDKLRP